MPKKRGDHYKQNETKRKIIEFVLDYPDGVEEPRLREYLKDTLDISEQKNIKIHLEDLRKKGCLEKTERTGFANKWVVKDAKNLMNISQQFGESFLTVLQQKEYTTTLITTLFFDMEKMNDPEFRKTHNELFGDLFNKFKFMLKYSPTFFNYVIHLSISGDFYDDANRLFFADSGFILSDNGYLLVEKGKDYEERLNQFEEWQRIPLPSNLGITDLIKHCLKHDILLGVATGHGKERLKQILLSEHKNKRMVDNQLNKIFQKRNDVLSSE